MYTFKTKNKTGEKSWWRWCEGEKTSMRKCFACRQQIQCTERKNERPPFEQLAVIRLHIYSSFRGRMREVDYIVEN